MEKEGMAAGWCSLGGFCFKGTPFHSCAVWSQGSVQFLWSHSAARCPQPWAGFARETLRSAGVGWTKLQGIKGVFIYFWALHSSTEWCCVGNGESGTLLKGFHFRSSEICFHISESNWLPAVHQPYVIFMSCILHSLSSSMSLVPCID